MLAFAVRVPNSDKIMIEFRNKMERSKKGLGLRKIGEIIEERTLSLV